MDRLRVGLDPDEIIEGFDGFDPDRQKTAAARKDVRQMLAAVHDWKDGKTPFVTLVSTYGVGKTRLLQAAVEWIRDTWSGDPRVNPVYYMTAAYFDRKVKDFRDTAGTYDGWTDPDVWVDRLANDVRFLAIDDIGSGYIDKGWTLSRFERLIDLRYRAERSTLIASNCTGQAFVKAMGERVYSRLWDGRIGNVVVLEAARDLRPALGRAT